MKRQRKRLFSRSRTVKEVSYQLTRKVLEQKVLQTQGTLLLKYSHPSLPSPDGLSRLIPFQVFYVYTTKTHRLVLKEYISITLKTLIFDY